MRLIAHRGNFNGPSLESENNPTQIEIALSKGLDCEIDVRYINGSFFLGHDEPSYKVEESFLEDKRLWCHAKNLKALEKMLTNESIHCFWHDQDDYTITSNKFIWTFPNKLITKKSVIVDLNPSPNLSLSCYGVCANYLKT
tara:strand:+ start:204 stop:626 length:423 start_codon:yes stop_codon:yes gene_type:complete